MEQTMYTLIKRCNVYFVRKNGYPVFMTLKLREALLYIAYKTFYKVR